MADISRDQLLTKLCDLRPEFEREGVSGLSIFGSRARGDNRPDSDVDILVDVATGRKFGLEAVGVAHIVESNFSLSASVITRQGLSYDPAFASRIAQDEVRVF